MSQKNKIKGKKFLAVFDDCLIASNGYTLYRCPTGGGKWTRYAHISDGINSLFSIFRLSRRLTRAEITKLYRLKDGSELCIARKGIFKKEKDSASFKKCFNVIRGSRPMNLCIDDDGKIYFGEYFMNMEKKAVHIYCSEDNGDSWKVVYTFEDGNINHIHGIYKDPYTDLLWVATGDRENECIIANTNDGFKTLNIVFRGGQDYRTCALLFYKEHIVFATDSQYQQNYIKTFNRETLEIKELQAVQGPVIRGGQIGDLSFISTDVEESEVNLDKNVYIWVSKDGITWKQAFSAAKDWLPFLFQYGVFDIPNYAPDAAVQKLYFTGKAVKKYDNVTFAIDINNL